MSFIFLWGVAGVFGNKFVFLLGFSLLRTVALMVLSTVTCFLLNLERQFRGRGVWQKTWIVACGTLIVFFPISMVTVLFSLNEVFFLLFICVGLMPLLFSVFFLSYRMIKNVYSAVESGGEGMEE